MGGMDQQPARDVTFKVCVMTVATVVAAQQINMRGGRDGEVDTALEAAEVVA